MIRIPGRSFEIGWAVGHAYTVYAPLLNGCTTILYEGKPVGTPEEGVLWRGIEEFNGKTLFIARRSSEPSSKQIRTPNFLTNKT
jgi:propionyl-CoA synthetase